MKLSLNKDLNVNLDSMLEVRRVKNRFKKAGNGIFILVIILLFLISFVSAISSPPIRFWGFGNVEVGDLIEAYDNEGKIGRASCRERV